jgi:protein TonB
VSEPVTKSTSSLVREVARPLTTELAEELRGRPALRGESPQQGRRDDRRTALIFGGTLLISIVTHVATAFRLPTEIVFAPKSAPVEMEFFEPPPPPPKEEPKPEPPKPPEPPKVKLPPPPVKVAVEKPPEPTPPPPNEEPPPEASAKPVPLVVGLSLSSTTAGGSFAVGVGNTSYGKASNTATDPSQVQAYRAPKYVPPGGADTEPALASEFKPAYPDEAKKNEIEGTVVLRVNIDENGNVTDAKVQKGLGYGLDEASISAMRKFKFKPATKGGEAVATTILYNFSWYLD